MFRAVLAVASAAALQLAALGAPLVHAHLDGRPNDGAGHHVSTRIHAHLGGHGADHDNGLHDSAHEMAAEHAVAGETSANGEAVIPLDVFVAEQTQPFSAPGVPQERYRLAVPLESAMRRPPAVTHSHDPPAVRSARPRAPPAPLS